MLKKQSTIRLALTTKKLYMQKVETKYFLLLSMAILNVQ